MAKHKILKKEKHIVEYELSHLDKVIIGILILFGTVMFFVGVTRFINSVHIFDNYFILIGTAILIFVLTGSFIKVRSK